MTEYVRPMIEPLEFRDAAGEIIPYGSRWAEFDGTPPEDSYSVDPHPERFAPLHDIADALVAHLAASYDVAFEEEPDLATGWVRDLSADWVERAVTLTPRCATAAPLTFVFTRYPGLMVHAGVLCEWPFPTCGCDACDETWEAAADDLEWRVLTIVGGGFSERVSPPRRKRTRYVRGEGLVTDMGRTVEYSLRSADGRGEGAQTSADGYPHAALDAAVSRLTALDGGQWDPWSRRPPSGETRN